MEPSERAPNRRAVGSIPVEVDLWSTNELGAYLKVSPNKVVERYAALPDFPKRIVLPTAEGGRSHPRWKALDVISWAEQYVEN